MIPLSVTSLPFLKVKVTVKVQGRVKYPNPTSSRPFPMMLEMKYKGKGYGVLMLKDRREIPGGEGGDMGFFLFCVGVSLSTEEVMWERGQCAMRRGWMR